MSALSFRLTDEQRAFIDAIARVRREVLEPNALRWLDGSWPEDSLRALASIGVMGMAVPQQYGGSGLGILDTALALEEIGKGCYVTAMAVLGEVGVQTRIVAEYAPAQLKERILPRVASGQAILAICMTEPDAGTDVASYRTNTRIDGDRVVINGRKTLISRADIADLLVVFTRVDGVPGAAGIGCVLVGKGAPGLRAEAKYHTMGGEYLCEVSFDDCVQPRAHLVIAGQGLRRLMTAFNTQRILNPAICLGLAEGALEQAVKYLRERSAFGRPIGEFQGLRWKIADMYVDLEAGRSLLYRAAVSGDRYPDPTLAAAAKIYCNQMGIRVTSEAIQVHGGYGFVDEFPVSRFFRGARYGSLGGGTTETLRNLIARKLVDDMDLATGLAGLDQY